MRDPAAPSLAALTRRLAATPGDFLAPRTVAPAVLADAVFAVHGAVLDAAGVAAVRAGCTTADGARATALTGWLLTEPGLAAAGRAGGAQGALAVLAALVGLADDVRPARWVGTAERREEVARTALAALGVVPAGESPVEAHDRLLAVSSSARRAAVRGAAAAERRAQEIAAALAATRAAEAAAQYTSL